MPLSAVTRISAAIDPAERARCAVASPLGAPNLFLHLAAPVALEGVMGLRRRGDILGLRLDDSEGLRAAIAARRPELAR